MTDNDPYPEPVKEAVEYAREELDDGFAPNPEDFYKPNGTWSGSQNGARRTFTGLGVHIERDIHSDSPTGKRWKVEVRMANHSSADPLLIEDDLSADEMQNVIRAFQYQLKWSQRNGEYEPSYDRKD